MSLLKLSDPPGDGVSSLDFDPKHADRLLCSSWDTTVRCYDLSRPAPLLASVPQPSACLSACFFGSDGGGAVVGSVDGVVRCVRVDGARAGGAAAAALGSHEAGARCVARSGDGATVFSGSWDKTVGRWDPRAPGRAATARVPGKVFAMDVVGGGPDGGGGGGGERIVVGTSDRHVLVFDARRLDAPLQHRESSLKHQTRCLRCFPDGTGFAVSSIEGRVAIEYFGEADQARKYAFKCHRAGKVVFPVNALAFHPKHGTFATGGSDGLVNLWDGQHKKRLCQLDAFPTSVAALAFNADGTKLAVASSYCFEEGEKDHPKDEIYVHAVMDHQVAPKAAPAPA